MYVTLKEYLDGTVQFFTVLIKLCEVWFCHRECTTSEPRDDTLQNTYLNYGQLHNTSHNKPNYLKVIIKLYLKYNSHHVLHHSYIGPEYRGSCCTLLLFPVVDQFSYLIRQWYCAALWFVPHSVVLFAPARLHALSLGGIVHTEAEKQGTERVLRIIAQRSDIRQKCTLLMVFLLIKPILP